MQKILIVEDEEILRSAYVSVFKIEKFKVDEAANGKIALEKLKSFNPDIVILDIMMPVMSGVEFLQQADISTAYPTTKVLVLSNISDRVTVDNVKSLGASMHLIKSSMSPAELVKTVRSLLK